MTLRLSLFAVAALMFVTVLASLSQPAAAYAIDPSSEDSFASARMLASGPLTLLVEGLVSR